MTGGIRHPFDTPPDHGSAVEIADGILWLRLPLPMALDHVNIYALADADGWTLVDTGMNSRKSKAIFETALAGPLAGKPVARVLLTHHHPDHVGLVGWFQDRGAELLTTRTAWLYARMLTLDLQDRPSAQAMQFYTRAGTPPGLLHKRANERPFNFGEVVAPMPLGFTRVNEGDTLTLAGRRWHVRLGQGHAPDHITLWSQDDNLVIGGDQLLPGISANIGVYPTEPDANPLADWLTSTDCFKPHSRDDQLILPGHKLPFTGLPLRLTQMAENHHSALDRLRVHLQRPQTAATCFPALFKRPVGEAEFGLALVEAVAHLNYLLQRDEVLRSLGPDGAFIWHAL